MSLLGNLVTSNSAQLLSFSFTAGSPNGNITVTGLKAGDIVLALINQSNNNYEGNLTDFRRVVVRDDTLFQGGATMGDNYLVIVLRP